MAIDTRDRRASALRFPFPTPDGAIGQGDRQQVLWQYRGLLGSSASSLITVEAYLDEPGGMVVARQHRTVGEDLTWCQRFLQDDAAIWSRAELLDWYRDAYRLALARARLTRTLRILDVPGRYTLTYTHPWERRHTQGGTSVQLFHLGRSGAAYTYPWELEHAEGVTPTDGAPLAVTQIWEYAHPPTGSTAVSQRYGFALPRNHEHTRLMYYDHAPVSQCSVRELDALETPWWQTQGDPWVWTQGLMGQRTFEIYEIVATYHQGYDLLDSESSQTVGARGIPYGVPRELSGTRSYTSLETDDAGGVPYGVMRSVTSPARQYLAQPTVEPPLGTPREWHTGDESLALYEVTLPDVPDLHEDAYPWMLPGRAQKYLCSFVLWRAFARQGEGYRPDVAEWFAWRWQRGLRLLEKLSWLGRHDQPFTRQGAVRRRAVPRPRLPSTFARGIFP